MDGSRAGLVFGRLWRREFPACRGLGAGERVEVLRLRLAFALARKGRSSLGMTNTIKSHDENCFSLLNFLAKIGRGLT
jgi:hypothetical protein